MGYQSIYAIDELSEDIESRELISPQIRTQASTAVFEIHEKTGLLQNIKKIESLRQIAKDIIIDVVNLDYKSTTIDFPELKSFDNYLYLHSVNVAVLGVVLGWKLGLKQSDLEDYALGAMLHDIGTIDVSSDILHKPGRLTEEEFEEVKKHSRNGFQRLSQCSFLKPTSFSISLQHHESYDGTGYPAGRKGEAIHIFSRIAAIVDIFDALTTDRPFKKRWDFHRTLEYLRKDVIKKLDPNILSVFMKLVPDYPTGTYVELSTGEHGLVISNQPNNVRDPKIRITTDVNGKPIPKDAMQEISLGGQREIQIVSSVES